MRPFINWACSREKDMGVILPLIPKDIETFVDPFVGDGACFLAVKAKNYALADKNQELINAYRAIQTGGPRLKTLLPNLVKIWKNCDESFELIKNKLLELKHSVDLGLFAEYPEKIQAINRITFWVNYSQLFPMPLTEPIEFEVELRHQLVEALDKMDEQDEDEDATALFYTAFKAAVFYYLVEVFNKPESKNTLRAALLVFLMEYALADKYVEDMEQFRPDYAGSKVNQRGINDRIDTIVSPALAKKLEATRTYCQDIFRSLGYSFAKEAGSFLFLDVPKTGPQNLTAAGHTRLADFLVSGTKARWMVICQKDDPMVEVLTRADQNQTIVPLGKELIITNY